MFMKEDLLPGRTNERELREHLVDLAIDDPFNFRWCK